tara:strand:- start:515 stop:775 length:261 start_codon:yes stop_codon:yes gene_type:complete
MKHYPIWTEVTACNYKSSKSFGSIDTSEQNIYVGTSAKNSNHLAKLVTTRRVIGDNTHFKISIDNIIMKEMIMCNKTKSIIKTITR